MSTACLCGRTDCTHRRRRNGTPTSVHYGAAYQSNRAVLMRRWLSDPNTSCARCGQRARTGDPWESGHKVDAIMGGTEHLSNLQPEHRSCNRRAGAQLAAARRKQKADERAAERIRATERAYLRVVR